jgi:hypothetical protein
MDSESNHLHGIGYFMTFSIDCVVSDDSMIDEG